MLAAQRNAIANHPAREVVFIAVWFEKLLMCELCTSRFGPKRGDKKPKTAWLLAKTDE
jgi:hypothetical protein